MHAGTNFRGCQWGRSNNAPLGPSNGVHCRAIIYQRQGRNKGADLLYFGTRPPSAAQPEISLLALSISGGATCQHANMPTRLHANVTVHRLAKGEKIVKKKLVRYSSFSQCFPIPRCKVDYKRKLLLCLPKSSPVQLSSRFF